MTSISCPLLPQKGKWIFNFKKTYLTEDELEKYQRHLLELRDKFQERVSTLNMCKFAQELPPLGNNIFATFKYECRRHAPKCNTSWYLIWNPNISPNKDKLNSTLNNHCATWEFKAVCKSIQTWLINACGNEYFELLDDDDTHPYCADMMNSLNFGFTQKEEEFPDSLTGSLENLSNINY